MAKTTITIAGQPDYIYVGETLGFNISTSYGCRIYQRC